MMPGKELLPEVVHSQTIRDLHQPIILATSKSNVVVLKNNLNPFCRTNQWKDVWVVLQVFKGNMIGSQSNRDRFSRYKKKSKGEEPLEPSVPILSIS